MSRMQRFDWLTRFLGHETKSNSMSHNNRRLRIEPLEDRRLLAVFSVSNLNDAGSGSLREAITLANGNGVADTIDFSVTGTINIASQLPTITDTLTISGPGEALLTVDAGDGADNTFATGDGYRIFDIDDGDNNNEIDVTLSGLTLTGGDTANGIDDVSSPTNAEDGGAIRTAENLTIIDTTVADNATGSGGNATSSGDGGNAGNGGGVFSSSGNLVITNSTISGNETGDGGDAKGVYYTPPLPVPHYYIAGNGGSGGGSVSSGNLTITGSLISANTTGTGGINLDLINSEFDTGKGSGGSGGGIHTSSGDITLSNTTLLGNSASGFETRGGGISASGDVTLTDSTLSGNSVSGHRIKGGGIYTSNGDVTLTRSTLSGNSTSGDNAHADGHAYGGGISATNVTLTNSTVSGNSTSGINGFGGGINAGIVTLINSTLSDNSTSGFNAILGPSFGGGISATNVILTNSTVSGNSTSGNSSSGGGIFATNVTLTNSTLSGNSTSGGDSNGGGINATDVTLIDSTISGNSTSANTFPTNGGGIFVNNAGGSLTISNSIVAGNTVAAGYLGPDFLIDPGATLMVEFSLIGDNADTILSEAQTPDVNGNFIGSTAGSGIIDPMLELLTDNGGSTETHALLPGSPAIDSGSSIEPFDQRGTPFLRDDGNGVDMGAFELQDAPLLDSADFDEDEDVDGFDFLAWQRGFGIVAPNAAKADGDADNDHDVDSSDLAVWELQYGTAPPLVAAVSESRSTEMSFEPSLTSGGLVDMAPAVALAERTNGLSDKQLFETHLATYESFPTHQPHRNVSEPDSSSPGSAATSMPSVEGTQPSEGPSSWKDAVDEAFASVFD
jgi:hypothetical protein